jgi:hypothetical protein
MNLSFQPHVKWFQYCHATDVSAEFTGEKRWKKCGLQDNLDALPYLFFGKSLRKNSLQPFFQI